MVSLNQESSSFTTGSVNSDNTAVIRVESLELQAEELDDSLMMRLFLDFAIAQALQNQDLKHYTTEMSVVARDLIEGVELDDA